MPKKEVESVRKPKRYATSEKNSAKKINRDLSDSGASDDDAVDLENPEPLLISKPVTKRSAAIMEDNDSGNQVDFTGEMTKILKNFSSDINKTLSAKRKRVEQYTQESLRATTKSIFDTTKSQSAERKKLVEEFLKQLSSFIEQAESELEKAKETEEKLQKFLVQHQKHHQQMRINERNRIRALKLLGDQFYKGMEDLESHHQQQYSSVSSDLKKEMSLLQKKILMETQQQEMMNVRKSLSSMLM